MSTNHWSVQFRNHRNLSVKQVDGVVDFRLEVNDQVIRIHEDSSGIQLETEETKDGRTEVRKNYYATRAEFEQADVELFQMYKSNLDGRMGAEFTESEVGTGFDPFARATPRQIPRPRAIPFPSPFSMRPPGRMDE